MDPHKILGDYGLNCSTAKAQAPAQVGLAYKDSGKLISIVWYISIKIFLN